jgi:hypothetical protein
MKLPVPPWRLALVIPLWLLFISIRVLKGQKPYDDSSPEDQHEDDGWGRNRPREDIGYPYC